MLMIWVSVKFISGCVWKYSSCLVAWCADNVLCFFSLAVEYFGNAYLQWSLWICSGWRLTLTANCQQIAWNLILCVFFFVFSFLFLHLLLCLLLIGSTYLHNESCLYHDVNSYLHFTASFHVVWMVSHFL